MVHESSNSTDCVYLPTNTDEKDKIITEDQHEQEQIYLIKDRGEKRAMIILVPQYWTSLNPHHVLMSL